MNKEKVEFYRKTLLKMRENILNKAKKLKEDSYNLGTDGIQDMADAASNTYNADILMSISDNDLTILKDIDNSLDKLSKGSYGICEECEEKISEKRLEANPVARYCITCKRQMEEKGL
ncbi:MAG TPA: TraR/DksA family transcriptional regulator [Syntrophorhabdaceae bacterium]|nr:TraR/DksA family transcriptional regulator [Syntrophorhabdaceae bacterium]HOD75311.1 TraR/DksA family transcriptional regulator [Syntrophorhabdaceae bacterium]